MPAANSIEYHVVLACPTNWTAAQAELLADRLIHEVPAAVGMYVWRLDDGKIAAQTCIREQAEDD